MDLAVVIPCHRRWDLLPSAIAAVGDHPVVVVNDAPPELVVCEPSGVTIIRTAGSQGFARAVNRGITAAQSQGASHVLLLNDDAQVEPGCIDALVAAWGADSGAVGPVLQDASGAISSAGIELAWWGRIRARLAPPAAAGPVDALSGACLLIAAHERMDERFVHGFEDIELCKRLWQQGKSVRIVPAARCRHLGGATLARDSVRAQRHAVSGHLRLLRHRRYVPVVVGLALAQVLREGGPAGRIRGIAAGVADWRATAPAGPLPEGSPLPVQAP